MSENLLFAKISEPEMTAINSDDPFRDRMGEEDKGHVEVFPKFWNFRPFNQPNGEITRIPRLMASYHKAREETKGWSDYKKLPEQIPEFPLIRRMLLGADFVVQTPRLRGFETNERRMAKFSETMDPCFVGRNAAVMQYTQFAYTDESTPKPGRFEKESAKLDLAPMNMRGKADLQEAPLIVLNVKSELAISGKLWTRTALAPFGCEEVEMKHGEEEDKSAGRLFIPKFPVGTRSEEKGPSNSARNQKRDDKEGEDRR